MTTLAAPPSATWIGSKLVDLQACLCQALIDRGGGGVCYCAVVTGEVDGSLCGSCDGEGDCGMAYVRIVRGFVYDAFPDNTGLANCALSPGFTIEAGVLRCLPVDETGAPLSSADSLDVSLQVAADMQAIYWALSCCFDVGDGQMLINAWEPSGPDGGCVGGFWTMEIGTV